MRKSGRNAETQVPEIERISNVFGFEKNVQSGGPRVR